MVIPNVKFCHCIVVVLREMKKQKVSSSEVVDANTLHDFSTAPVVHPVGSPPSKRRNTGEDTTNTTARIVSMPIAGTTLKNQVLDH